MYGIMRIEKRKAQAVGGLEREANRREVDHANGRNFVASDIDWSRTNGNIFLRHTDGWQEAIRERLGLEGIKPRSNSVMMLDGLYTTSQGYFDGKSRDEVKKFFQDCLDWHIKEFCQGDPTRVINAVVHMDETTPHMQVASIPLFERGDGRMSLSADALLGNRKDYRDRQDRFFESVSKSYGLERGNRSEMGEELRKHLDVMQFKKLKEQQTIDVLTTERDDLQKTNIILRDEVSSQQSVLDTLRGAIKKAYDEMKHLPPISEIQSIKERVKEHTIGLVKSRTIVEVDKDDFDVLVSSAEYGSKAYELAKKNKQLSDELAQNRDLKYRLGEIQKEHAKTREQLEHSHETIDRLEQERDEALRHLGHIKPERPPELER